MYAIDTPQPRRNVFSDVEASSFRWRQEWRFDGGVTWTPVAYIEATRVTNWSVASAISSNTVSVRARARFSTLYP